MEYERIRHLIGILFKYITPLIFFVIIIPSVFIKVETISIIKYYLLLVAAYFKYIFTLFFDEFREYPLEVKISLSTTIFAIFVILYMLITMQAYSRKEKWLDRQRGNLRKRFGEGMEWILSSQANELVPNEEIARRFGIDPMTLGKEQFKRDYEKKLFAEVFYQYYISIKSEGSRLENIHSMLNLFSIPAFLEREISIGSMKRKADALRMTRTFKLQVSQWVINKLMNTKNLHVQRLAMYSTIMSSSDSALDYFETDFFDINCCIRDEIELAYSLQRRRREGLKLPNLARWAHIQKEEKTQCMFVRLMRRFNEVEYCGELKDLFKESKKKKLIEEIARTWGYLNYVGCEDLLIETLLTQPDDTKVAIMHAMTRLGTGRSMNALLEGFKNTTNPHVRYEALRCMYNYGRAGREMFHKLESEASPADMKYFTFFKNPITLEKVRLDREQAYHPSVETVFNG